MEAAYHSCEPERIDYDNVSGNKHRIVKDELDKVRSYLIHLIKGNSISYEINEWYIKHTIKIKEEIDDLELQRQYQIKRYETLINELKGS